MKRKNNSKPQEKLENWKSRKLEKQKNEKLENRKSREQENQKLENWKNRKLEKNTFINYYYTINSGRKIMVFEKSIKIGTQLMRSTEIGQNTHTRTHTHTHL